LDIGKNIASIRHHFNLSQRDFALKLGISKATVSLWENNKKYPSRKNLENLATIFNLDPQDLFGTNVKEKLILQSQFRFRPTIFNIKQGVELRVETEKLSRDELQSVEKAIKLLKVFFEKLV